MPIYKAKTPTKSGKCWFFKVQHEDSLGNIKYYTSKKYATKTEAKDAERQYMTSVKDEQVIPSKMTMGQLWKAFIDYQDSRVRISTKRGYFHTAKYIEPVFNIKVTDFDLKRYEAWLNTLRNSDNLNIVSKNDKIKVFRAVLNFGRRHYNFDFNRILATPSRIKDPGAIRKEHNIYDLDEFKHFLSLEDDIRYRCLWLTLYFCGLRMGEARGLQWKDIDWDTKTMYIKKQVQSIDNCSGNWFMCDLKTTSSYRQLPMCDVLFNELRAYYDMLSSYKNFTEELFIFGPDCGLTPISHSQPQRRKKLLAQSGNIKEIRLHDFRHSCASLLISSGTPITTVSRFLGHASVTETLNTYSHMFKKDLDNVSETFNKLNVI